MTKGMEMFVIILLLLVFAGVVLFGVFPNISQILRTGGAVATEYATKSCKAFPALTSIIREAKPLDQDFGKNQGDEYPDSCDVCLGGDDENDKDADKIPDKCDNSPNKASSSAISECKKVCKQYSPPNTDCWDYQGIRCILPCYPGCTRG
ncbi:hypothetical protein HY486_02790 [Candidatus Woesearchaeota archaeon]|nr:hypothetical protein [Candidatus Woesearchaeota archaeon]